MAFVIGRRNQFHSVRDWFNGLAWDGKNHFVHFADCFEDDHEPKSINRAYMRPTDEREELSIYCDIDLQQSE